jgi:hypothetical protein
VKKKQRKNAQNLAAPIAEPEAPSLARRKMNRTSTIKSGRTIAEKRERLETANERSAARKKDKKKKKARIFFTSLCFLFLGGILVFLGYIFTNSQGIIRINETTEINDDFAPTIPIIDEDASALDGEITNKMKTFIGKAEQDFRDLGYTPTKAVIPTKTIREVDFYLEGYNGYIKTTINRGSAVSAEDADRLIRYLKGQNINDFTYIDVRIEHKAYWK